LAIVLGLAAFVGKYAYYLKIW